LGTISPFAYRHRETKKNLKKKKKRKKSKQHKKKKKIRLPYSKLKKNNLLGCFIFGDRKCVLQEVGNHSPSFPASYVIRNEVTEFLLKEL
jgi:hypothetical protein